MRCYDAARLDMPEKGLTAYRIYRPGDPKSAFSKIRLVHYGMQAGGLSCDTKYSKMPKHVGTKGLHVTKACMGEYGMNASQRAAAAGCAIRRAVVVPAMGVIFRSIAAQALSPEEGRRVSPALACLPRQYRILRKQVWLRSVRRDEPRGCFRRFRVCLRRRFPA